MRGEKRITCTRWPLGWRMRNREPGRQEIGLNSWHTFIHRRPRYLWVLGVCAPKAHLAYSCYVDEAFSLSMSCDSQKHNCLKEGG